MKLSKKSTLIFLIFGLSLGLESCTSDKSDPSASLATPPELKIRAPSIVHAKDNSVQILTDLDQNLKISSLDSLSFDGYSVRGSDSVVKLNSKTICQFEGREYSFENRRPMENQIYFSEILPTEFFASPNHHLTEATCRFEFVAIQPQTRARHEFNLTAEVEMPLEGDLSLFEGQFLLRPLLNQKPFSPEQFPQMQILSSRSSFFELHCESFVSPLSLEQNRISLGDPIWKSPHILSQFPMLEDPRQHCRVLGFNQRGLSSWSLPFVLQSPVPPPSVNWTYYQHKTNYRGRQENPPLPIAQLEVSNPHLFPITLRINREFWLSLHPLCVKEDKGATLRRLISMQFATSGDAQLLQDLNTHIVVRLGPKALVRGELSYRIDLRCQCQDYGQLSTDGRVLPSPWTDYEAGFYLHLESVQATTVELTDLPSRPGDLPFSIANLLQRMDSPARWLGNLPPRFTQSIDLPVSELQRRNVKRDICR
ncbi:MAG: hypothetical protein H6624_18535 [Bdellovibrionaceae bacterium]|nr:hypothetical protein [Bdellovibrionales bacterium]MCB9086343.1 hypothetical protein [Pseudobdellovibrionaceae bacterium]